VHPSDLAGGFSNLEMTWLLYCAGAANGHGEHYSCHLQRLYLYEPHFAFSGVTFPLHRHIRPFTANEAFSPRDGTLYPVSPPRGVRGGLCRLSKSDSPILLYSLRLAVQSLILSSIPSSPK